MCNAALQQQPGREGKTTGKAEKGNVRACVNLPFGFLLNLAGLISSPARPAQPARLCPVFFPTGAKCGGRVRASRTNECAGVFGSEGAEWACRIRVPMPAGDLILVRINSVALPKKVTGRNQEHAITNDIAVQQVVKERARDGARVLPVYKGKARGRSR